MRRLNAASAPASLRDCSQARHDTAVSAVAGEAQVQGIVLTQTVRTTRAKGPFRRVDCSYRGDAAKESALRLPTDCRSGELGFRYPRGQTPGAARAGQACRPGPGSGGPSWLTFLGHSKDSLWSVDLFRCESLILKTHWVIAVMDQCTRRIVGFAVCGGSPDGPTVCRMLRHIILGSAPPIHLSSDHDPLFEYHRWKSYCRGSFQLPMAA